MRSINVAMRSIAKLVGSVGSRKSNQASVDIGFIAANPTPPDVPGDGDDHRHILNVEEAARRHH